MQINFKTTYQTAAGSAKDNMISFQLHLITEIVNSDGNNFVYKKSFPLIIFAYKRGISALIFLFILHILLLIYNAFFRRNLS